MSKTDVNKILETTNDSPEHYYRDTGMILRTLDNLQKISREFNADIEAVKKELAK